MARAFTTSFSHNGETYIVVITQIDGSMNVYVPDETLHGIIPNGKATFQLEQGLKIDALQLNPQQQLMLNILTSQEFLANTTSKKVEVSA